MLTRKLLICALLLAFLFTACSPPISGDAGTYAEPTRNVWGETTADNLRMLTDSRATREAGR